MEDSNKPKSEPIITPEVIAETEAVVVSNEREAKRGGRPSVIMDKELLNDYLRIYHLSSVGQYLPEQIIEHFAKEGKSISESKVYYACNWCREKWTILSTREYLVDAENITKARIREYSTMIEVAKRGEPQFKLNGEPLIDALGNQVMLQDKDHVKSLMRDRTAQERTLFQLRGLLDRAQTVIQNTAFLGDAHIEMVKKLSLFEIMEEPDKQKYIEIFHKYGKLSTPDEAN